MFESLEVRPAPKPRHVFDRHGQCLPVPHGWELLPPGDAALSRRLKADGPCWTVKQQKGRRQISHGIWAPAERIEALRRALAIERADPAYQRKLQAGRARRAAQQVVYAQDFTAAVRDYLDFHPRYRLLAERLAQLIAAHATPVGSGTVARTQRIPLAQRAEAATIAWMRHQTTAYDQMHIARTKGSRREVRRALAQQSKRLLHRYRHGVGIDVEQCPLQQAIRQAPQQAQSARSSSAP